jgi:tetratricopeptide (TPR) repeat protein
VLAAAVAVALAVPGCTKSITETFAQNMDAAKHYFDNGRFAESLKHYKLAVEEMPDDYPAVLGMAITAGETSNDLFERASEMQAAGKLEPAMRLVDDGIKHATLADKSFQRCLQLRTDTPTNYNLGLFLYKRATSQRNVPYPQTPEPPPEYTSKEAREEWAKAYLQRPKELDESIRQFLIVLEGEPGALGSRDHAYKCKSHQAHRYLGLAYFWRSDWSKRDGEQGRLHMYQFLVYVEGLREFVVKKWPQTSDAEKARKDRELKNLDADLSGIRTLLRDRVKHLLDYDRKLRDQKEEPRIVAFKDRENRIAAVAVELSGLDALLAQLEKAARAGPAEVPKK